MIPIIQNPPYIFPCRLLTMSLHKGEGICLLLMKHSSQCSRTLDQLMTVRILTGLQIQQTVLTCRFQIPKVVECILWKNKFKTVVKQLQSSGGSKGGARWAQASPLFLDQTEAWRAEKFFFWDQPPTPFPLSQGLHDRTSPLSEGLDRPLQRIQVINSQLPSPRSVKLISCCTLWKN